MNDMILMFADFIENILQAPKHMSKNYIDLLVVSGLMFLFSLSAVSAQPKTSNPAPKKIPRLHLLRLSEKVAGSCTGFVVGTPICFVKKLASETDYGAHEMVGGFTDDTSKGKLLIVPVTMAWLPAAAVTSLAEAPFYSFKNAVTADRPFSKEQFSLHDFDMSR